MTTTGVIKCPICGKPYRWFAHTTADQSACPACVAEADSWKRTPGTWNWNRDRN